MDDLNTRFETIRYDSAKRQVYGYGAVFYDGTAGTEFQLSADTFERIHPNAFDESLSKNNVKLYRMHNRSQGLARTPGTLKLSKDKRGIAYEATLIDSTNGRDAMAELESGYLTGASVGMRFGPSDVMCEKVGNKRIATIMKAELVEISLVDDPAYQGTSAVLRFIGDMEKQMTVDDMQKEIDALLIRSGQPKR